MAKRLNKVTVTVKHEDTEITYTAPQGTISGIQGNLGKHLTIQLFDYASAGMTTKLKGAEAAQVNSEDPHLTKVKQHTGVILDVLKAAETTRLNSALKREKFEAEIAAQERADRIALIFAVHNAIQAGVQEEQITETLRDDHAGYVSDMFEKVFPTTDIDSVLNVS